MSHDVVVAFEQWLHRECCDDCRRVRWTLRDRVHWWKGAAVAALIGGFAAGVAVGRWLVA